ncbi:hypothetical protein MPTA5024_18555 [Microbispora sp. ATCC PTA-5024]|nr:hypothetical protein MPTA5024_18555 [Microbispora sp. ATCC PTA-5024]
MRAIRPSTTVNAMTDSGVPSPRHDTNPGRPSTSTARPRAAAPARTRLCAPEATSVAPRTTTTPPGVSTVSFTSGSRTRSSPSKSPLRAADRKAWTTSRCSRPAAAGRSVVCTFLRARLASIFVASVDLPRILPISSNGTANRSCSTNASRSLGLSDSRTTRSASPTESASATSSSGTGPSSTVTTNSGRRSS